MLWMYQRVFYGRVVHEENAALADLGPRERLTLWPLAVMALIMGVAPVYWLNHIDPAAEAALKPVQQLEHKAPVRVTGR